MRKVEKSADGSSLSQVTKTDRFAQSGILIFFCFPHHVSFNHFRESQ